MTAKRSPLLQYALGACFREACTRTHNARLVFLGVVFSQYAAKPPGPIDVGRIDRAAELFHKEENRRRRIREALADWRECDGI